MKYLATGMESRLHAPMKKLVQTQIEKNGWMRKLIEFYQEECGSSSPESISSSSSEEDSDTGSDLASKVNSSK